MGEGPDPTSRDGLDVAAGFSDSTSSSHLMTITPPDRVSLAGAGRRALFLMPVVAALVHPLAYLLARYEWHADLLTHFQEPALVVTLIAIASTVWRQRKLALALAVLAVWQTTPLLRYEGANPVPPDRFAADRLRVLMSNVEVDNEDPTRLAELIVRERPDIVGLVEVSEAWLAGLAEVREQFPYRIESPAGASGLALWFRQPPLATSPAERLVSGGWPVLRATFEFAGRPHELWLVHPASPLRHQRRRAGNPELDALAARVRQAGGSELVVGDLNCTDGSPHFGDFLRVSGLRDGRLGFGRQPSWPTWSPYRIAIDHAFLSPDLAVVSRRLGPDIGSDHRPLILEVAPAAGTAAAMKAVTHAPHRSS